MIIRSSSGSEAKLDVGESLWWRMRNEGVVHGTTAVKHDWAKSRSAPITTRARLSFQRAFGLTVEEQLELEDKFRRGIFDPSVARIGSGRDDTLEHESVCYSPDHNPWGCHPNRDPLGVPGAVARAAKPAEVEPADGVGHLQVAYLQAYSSTQQ